MENKANSGQMIIEFITILMAFLMVLTLWSKKSERIQMEELIDAHELKALSI